MTLPNLQIPDDYVFLTSCGSEMEALEVISLLDSCGIPVMRIQKGISDVLKLYTIGADFGITLLVPHAMLEDAKEILQAEVKVDWESLQAEGAIPPDEGASAPLNGGSRSHPDSYRE